MVQNRAAGKEGRRLAAGVVGGRVAGPGGEPAGRRRRDPVGVPGPQRWTNLPTRKDFTPLVMQLANHVARRPPVDAPAVVLADGAAEFVVNGLWGDVRAEVKKPSGGDPIPVQFERNGPRLLASFTDTSETRLLHAEREEPLPGPGTGGQRGVRRELVAGGVGLHDAEQGAAARTIAIREADFRGRHGRRGEGAPAREGRATPPRRLTCCGSSCCWPFLRTSSSWRRGAAGGRRPGRTFRERSACISARAGSWVGSMAGGAVEVVVEVRFPIAEHGLHCRGFGGSVGFLLPFVLLLSGGSEGNGSW